MLSTFVTNLLYSVFISLSTSVFKLAKFDFSAKLLASTRDTFFKSIFIA